MKKFKKSSIVFCACGMLALIIVATIYSNSITSASHTDLPFSVSSYKISDITPKEQMIEFDKKTQPSLIRLQYTHNQLTTNFTRYNNGEITKLDFYEYCQQAENDFQEAYMSLDCGTTINEEYYYDLFGIATLTSQTATQKLKSYLDSSSESDLFSAEEDIATSKEMIDGLSNLKTFWFENAGFTDEEIQAIVNEAVI